MLPVVQMVFLLIYFSHSSEQPAPPLFDVAKKIFKKPLANPKHLFVGARLTCRHLVLLVTLTASATVSISDLSVNSLEDRKEREEILKRYVRM